MNKKNRFKYHFLFWMGIWLFYLLFFSYNSNTTNYNLLLSTTLIPITAFATYAMVYYIIPKFLSTKKYVWFVIYTSFTLLFVTFYTILVLVLSIAYLNKYKFEDLPPLGRNYIIIIILVSLIVTLVSYVSLWRKSIQETIKNNELKKQLLTIKFHAKEQELTYLKNQIHPHFLFNTLNTLYGFALKKSVETPEMILKLSNLLDYILYQIEKPSVLLSEELQHIEDYIALEKIRFQNTLQVNFISENSNPDFQIAPMLLLPFVENAFKHGRLIDGFLSIDISAQSIDNQLDFTIKNTIVSEESHQIKEGIGLENIKKRLDLLYLNNYKLTIEDKNNWFKVNLSISNLNTSKNV